MAMNGKDGFGGPISSLFDKIDWKNPIEDQPYKSKDGFGGLVSSILDEVDWSSIEDQPDVFVRPHIEVYGRSQIMEGEFPDYGGSKVMEGPVRRGLGRSLLARRPREGGHYPPFDANKRPPPKEYIDASGAAAGKVSGTHGLQALPNMGIDQSAGTWGMQYAPAVLMVAVCYMLYALLKKRACSLSCGWKDKDDGDLERDA